MLRNPSEATTMLIAEPDIASTKQGSFLQLNRRGYFRFDHKEGETLHLFQIPDGKQKAMSTLSTKLEHR